MDFEVVVVLLEKAFIRSDGLAWLDFYFFFPSFQRPSPLSNLLFHLLLSLFGCIFKLHVVLKTSRVYVRKTASVFRVCLLQLVWAGGRFVWH